MTRWKTTLLLGAFAVLVLCTGAIAQSGRPGPRSISQKDIPLVITEPGSYRLVSNLNVTDPDITAIFVATNHVTIDLAGFTIIGPGSGQAGVGYAVNTAVQSNVVVHGGAVKGFVDPTGACIHLPGHNNRVENVRVEDCPQQAIFVGSSSTVVDCQIAYSGSGINTDDASLVLNNTLFQISGSCIMTSGGAPSGPGGVSVIGNNCRNTGSGIVAIGPGNRIEQNVVTASGTGIDLTGSMNSYFASNLLQGNGVALAGQSDDTDGGSIDAALSNIILP